MQEKKPVLSLKDIRKVYPGVVALDNVSIFFWCTLITFAAFVLVYILVYLITARVYFRTVSVQERR